MTPFDFNANVILEDDKVLLRPLQLSDTQHLIPYTVTEPDLWKYSVIPLVGTAGMNDYVRTAIEARDIHHREFPFIVYDKIKQAYAGSTRFYDIQPANDSLQLGYTWYGKDFQGTGLNKHCKFLLLQYAFDQLGMERVEFRAAANNEKSIAAMKSIGCTVEGILRSHIPLPAGGRRNSIVLSILKSEWVGEAKDKLQQKLV